MLKIFGVEKDDEGDEGNNAIPKGPNGVKTSFSGMFLYKSYGIKNMDFQLPKYRATKRTNYPASNHLGIRVTRYK